jgi:ankyrin repeat protein
MKYLLFLLSLLFLSICLFSQNKKQDSMELLIHRINEIDIATIKTSDFSNQINNPYKKGKYPIHYAVEKENIELIKVLIDQGADINSKDSVGYSPFHYSVMSKKLSLVNYLLQKGANKYALNNRNEFPIDIAYNIGHEQIVSFLLPKNGIANRIEKYRLWRNQYYFQSSTWTTKSTSFRMAWITGSIFMGELYKTLKDSINEEEIQQYKILEETQKHFDYDSEFQIDMNNKISLCDQLLSTVAKETANIEILISLSMFIVPSNQFQIQLQSLKTNIIENPISKTNFLINSNINHGKN